LKVAHRGMGKVVFDSDPKLLMDKVVAMIETDEKEANPADFPIAEHRIRG
jgi:hypothetical protein